MEWLILLARLLLAAVFLVAGLAKLAGRKGSQQAVAEFGLAKWLAPPIALVLPFVELAIAALLIWPTSVRWGALLALGLLVLFTAAVSFSLARGRKPNCHCFGQLHATPIGWRTVIRNGFLVAVAVFVLWQNGESANFGSLMAIAGFQPAIGIALTIAIGAVSIAAFEAWFLFNMLRQQGRFLIRLEAVEGALGLGPGTGLAVGHQAPEFELQNLTGEQSTLATLRALGQPVLLFFTNPDCEPCDALLPDVARWQREHSDRMVIGVISRGSIEANRAKAEKHNLRAVLVQKGREVAEAYNVESTPAGVLVGSDGRIGSRVGYGADGVEDLVRKTLTGVASARGEFVPHEADRARQPAAPSVPAVGQLAPPLVFSDLDGRTANLAGTRESALILFWNPACGFCQRMLPALKAWERKRPVWAPQLLVVSLGTVEANRAMGLASRVVVDADGAAMHAFGAHGTPMAVLLDSSGRIASPLAAGEHAVMALARTRHNEPAILSA